MVGLIAQLTGIDSGPHIVVNSRIAADRREDAVLHVNAVHVRNPGRGTHDANRLNNCPFACDHCQITGLECDECKLRRKG